MRKAEKLFPSRRIQEVLNLVARMGKEEEVHLHHHLHLHLHLH